MDGGTVEPAAPACATPMLEALAEPHRGVVRALLEPSVDPEPDTDGSPEPATPPGLDVLLTVLAEPRRQELVRLLEHEQLTQGQIVDRLGLSQPLLSHHLKVLREAGLVEKTVCGRLHVYRLRGTTLVALAERLTRMAENALATARVEPC